MSSKIETRVAHPCQYCSRSCFGKQCKECHVSMVSAREGKCVDCSEMFYALRKDGSKRIRCNTCQDAYAKIHISNCSDCGESFHAVLKDGRTFNKCLNCYKKEFTNCKNCSKTTRVEYPLCKECYTTEKSLSTKKKEKKPVYESHACNTKGCPNKTTYSLCFSCNESFKDVANAYMISTCQFKDCGYRGKGSFKYCETHRA